MARRSRPEPPGPSGFLVVDKPPGATSHDMVDAARRWLGTRRVGHLGTLDPQATGCLPLAVREATKLVPFLEGGAKHYAGSIHLGVRTDTLDGDGRVLSRYQGPLPSEDALREALAAFLGEILQTPPMFSALKRGGVPLHKLARRGEQVERAPRRVRIDRFALLRYEPPLAHIEVECSAGTYVRSLAADVGERLECGAYLEALRRTRSGPFTLEQAAPPEVLEDAAAGKLAERLVSEVDALGFPVLALREDDAQRVGHGGDVAVARSRFADGPGTRVAAVDAEGRLVAVMELRPDYRLRPLRVLRPLGAGPPV